MTHKLTAQEMNRITVEEFRASEKLPLTVVLDNVRSLNNIGSVFRTSDAFRVEHIALCGITATPPHRDIHKTALGAEDSVEWSYHEDSVECVKALKANGYQVYAIEQVDDSIKLPATSYPLTSPSTISVKARKNSSGPLIWLASSAAPSASCIATTATLPSVPAGRTTCAT